MLIEKKKEDRDSGPFTSEELDRAKQLVEEIGSQSVEGFFIAMKKTTTNEDDEGVEMEIEGMAKVSNVNRQMILDTLFQALGMDGKEILRYATSRMVLGTMYDSEDEDGD